ncbi:hypothetical protein IQ235_06720 [Oscillatoriales cyanobacterium LEGE 11467]|uniref:Thioesterase domain-containing protein n=1 Tax=Zarconia navalis LEGE 11467 TaxID=1828826 RepID=A0A928VUI9_9CYAN|nr:thioesterase domain-containing protein [Zarconia navalis]MBE9040482.1 hypothetical protein [Zarconia navalis LEGE 11467]
MNNSISTSSINSSAWLHLDGSLVSLEPGGSKRPFFLIHDVFGNTEIYRDLARHLGSDRPIYGLKPLQQKGYPILHPRLKDSIECYSNMIQAVQPAGPYLLGGSGFGGVLAVEIAQQLYARGHWVGMVALFDSLNRQASKPSKQSACDPLEAARSLAPLTKFLERMGNRLKVKLYRYYLKQKTTLPKFVQNISLSTILNVAWQEYRSQVFHGEILLFRAKNGVGIDRPARCQTEDPLLGWEKSATLGIELHDIPGGHTSMLQEPNVQILARKLQASLNSAVSDESASSKVE